MSFSIFLLLTFFLIGRPQEFLTFLSPFRPALLLTIILVSLILVQKRASEPSVAANCHRNYCLDSETGRYGT